MGHGESNVGRGRTRVRSTTQLKREALTRDLSACSTTSSRSPSRSYSECFDYDSDVSSASSCTSYSEDATSPPDKEDSYPPTSTPEHNSIQLAYDLDAAVKQHLQRYWSSDNYVKSSDTRLPGVSLAASPDSTALPSASPPPPSPPPTRAAAAAPPPAEPCFWLPATPDSLVSRAWPVVSEKAGKGDPPDERVPVNDGSVLESLPGLPRPKPMGPRPEPLKLTCSSTRNSLNRSAARSVVVSSSKSDDSSRLVRQSEGLQRLPPNPRRTKTDPSRCMPRLVRQDHRKKTYVQTLVDVAVSLVAFIWPASQKPLRFNDPNSGKLVIDLRYFVEQILKRSFASHSTLQVALYYCLMFRKSEAFSDRRFVRDWPSDGLMKQDLALRCGRRMFLASLMLAFKFLQDRNYSSKAWSSISGLSVKDVNTNETAFLKAIKYSTFIRWETFDHWQLIINFCTETKSYGGQIQWDWAATTLEYSLTVKGNKLRDYLNELRKERKISDAPPFATVNPESETQSVCPRAIANGVTPQSASHLPSPPQSISGRSPTLEPQPDNDAVDDRCTDLPASPPPTPVRVVEDMAHFVPFPNSPDAKGPVAPPAPRMGAVSLPELSPQHRHQLGFFGGSERGKATVHDNDSGYESSSPESKVPKDHVHCTASLNFSADADSFSENLWDVCSVEPDDIPATGNTTAQDQARDLLMQDLDAILNIKETLVSNIEDKESHPYYDLQFSLPPEVASPPNIAEIYTSDSPTSAADARFYEENAPRIESLQEDVERLVFVRQKKKKATSSSSRRKRSQQIDIPSLRGGASHGPLASDFAPMMRRKRSYQTIVIDSGEDGEEMPCGRLTRKKQKQLKTGNFGPDPYT